MKAKRNSRKIRLARRLTAWLLVFVLVLGFVPGGGVLAKTVEQSADDGELITEANAPLTEIDEIIWESSPGSNGTKRQQDRGGSNSISGASAFSALSATEIYTVSDFDQMRSGAGLGGSYILMDDVDLTGIAWEPIGGGLFPFRGTFDGNGKTITGLTIVKLSNISSEQYNDFGLFGYTLGAAIIDLRLEDVNISVKVQTSLTDFEAGDIFLNVGGIVGFAERTIIENCRIAGEISGELIGFDNVLQYAESQIGGIAGEIQYPNPNSGIVNCHNSANVTSLSNSRAYAGGIAGAADAGIIEKCWNNGKITATGTDTGGSGDLAETVLAGGIAGTTNGVTDCYNDGQVSSGYTAYDASTLGLGRYAASGIASNNKNLPSQIRRCYNAGGVTGGAQVITKGVFHSITSSSVVVTNCYYLNTLPADDRAAGLSDAGMNLQGSYVGFDFDDTWIISAKLNGGYPLLGVYAKTAPVFINKPYEIIATDSGTYLFETAFDKSVTFPGVLFYINDVHVGPDGKPFTGGYYTSEDGVLSIDPEYYIDDFDEIKVRARNADYQYNYNDDPALSKEITVELSDDPQYDLKILESFRNGTWMLGESFTIHYKNPRHRDTTDYINEKGYKGYKIEMWKAQKSGGQFILDYEKYGTPLIDYRSHDEFVTIETKDAYDSGIIIEGEYVIRISYRYYCLKEREEMEHEDYAVVQLNKANLSVRFVAMGSTPPYELAYRYLKDKNNDGDKDEPRTVRFQFDTGNPYGDVSRKFTVTRNGQFFLTSNPSTNAYDLTFGEMENDVSDFYRVEIEVTDGHGRTATAQRTFDVYNDGFLDLAFAGQSSIKLGNRDFVDNNKNSADLFDLIAGKPDEPGLRLEHELSLNQNTDISWSRLDTFKWEIVNKNGSDRDTARIVYFSGRMWEPIPPDTYFSPSRQLFVIGGYDTDADNNTVLRVTHAKTGISKDILVELNSILDGDLYLIQSVNKNADGTVSRDITTASYYVKGESKAREVDSDANGRIVIYEQREIISETISLASNSGGGLYRGEAALAELSSGESRIPYVDYQVSDTVYLRSMSVVSFEVHEPVVSAGGYTHVLCNEDLEIIVTGGLLRRLKSADGDFELVPGAPLVSGNKYNVKGTLNIELDLAAVNEVFTNSSSYDYKYIFEMQFKNDNTGLDLAPVIIEIDAEYDSGRRTMNGSRNILYVPVDEGNPIITSVVWFDGESSLNITDSSRFDIYKGSKAREILTAYAVMPKGVSVDESKKPFTDTFNNTPSGQKIRELKYDFLSGDQQYIEITWKPNRIEFLYRENRVITYNATFTGENNWSKTISEALKFRFTGTTPEEFLRMAQQNKGLTVDIDPSRINIGSLAGTVTPATFTEDEDPNGEKAADLTTFSLSIDGMVFNTHIWQDENDPQSFIFKGVYTSKFGRTEKEETFNNIYKDVKHRLNLYEKIGLPSVDFGVNISAPLPPAPYIFVSGGAGLSVQVVGVEAFVEGRLVYDPKNDDLSGDYYERGTFYLELKDGYAVGVSGADIKTSIGVSLVGIVGLTAELSNGVSTSTRLVVRENADTGFDELILIIDTKFTQRLGLDFQLTYIVGRTAIGVYGLWNAGWETLSTYDGYDRTTKTGNRLGMQGKLGFTLKQEIGIYWEFIAIGVTVVDKNLGNPLKSEFWTWKTDEDSYIPPGKFKAAMLPLLADPPEPGDLSLDVSVVGHDRTLVSAESSMIKLAAKITLNDFLDSGYIDGLIASGSAGIEDVYGIMNQMEIAVDIDDSGNWHTLTDNSQPDIAPIVAVHDDKGVVVWQRQTMYNGEPVLIDNPHGLVEIPVMDVMTEIYYSVYDGSSWSQERLLDSIGSDTINDYSVVMNDSGFAVVMGAYDETAEAAYVTAYHVGNTGNITKNDLTNRAEGDMTTQGVNPQIALADNGFFLTYYRADSINGGYDTDIMAVKMSNSGEIGLDALSVKAASGLSIMQPVAGYSLSSDSGNAVIVCSAFDYLKEGDAIYALKIEDGANGLALSSPLLVVPADEGYILKITDVKLAGSNVTVNYEKMEMAMSADNLPGITPVTATATATFKNTFAYRADYSSLDVLPYSKAPVLFEVYNTGVNAITQITVQAGGITATSDYIVPQGEVTSISVSVGIGDNVTDVPYTITAAYENGDTEVFGSTLAFRAPDIAIGKITMLRADNAKRDISIRLYNNSGVPINENGNEILISVYSDPMRQDLTDTIKIKNQADIDRIDNGGLNVLYTYNIDPNGFIYDEIPDKGIWLYFEAEIMNGGNHVVQQSYTDTKASLGIYSLIQKGEPTVVISADAASDGTGIESELYIRNRSMKKVDYDSGMIIATLLDETGNAVEIQTVNLENDLPIEGAALQTIQFTQTGARVFAVFESDASSSYTIIATAGTGGTVFNGGTFASGERVTLTATPNAKYTFSGWYENNVKISSNAVYSFAATANRTLEARFISDTPVTPPINPPVGPYYPPSGNTTTEDFTSSIFINSVASTINVSNFYSKGSIVLSAASNKLANGSYPNNVFIIPVSTIVSANNATKAAAKPFEFILECPVASYILPANITNLIPDYTKLTTGKIQPLSIRVIIMDNSVSSKSDGAISSIVGFKLELLDANENVIKEISQFDGNIERRIPLNAAKPAYYGAYVRQNKNSAWSFVPHKYIAPATKSSNGYVEILSNTNSEYAVFRYTPAFTDVESSAWYYNNVTIAASKGLVQGMGNNLYEPENQVTRAEFITMIVRALRLPESKTDTAEYTDVKADDWFYNDVMKAKSANLLLLLGTADFKPNQAMTREEMAYVLAKAAEYCSIKASKTIDLKERFTDSATVSNQYTKHVETAVALGLMNGMSETTFEGKGTITRAQAATVLVRMCKLFSWIDE